MPRDDVIVVRLIVWEGEIPASEFRRQVKEYYEALQKSINYTMRATNWRCQIWKTRPGEVEGRYKLEVHIKHPNVGEKERYASIDKYDVRFLEERAGDFMNRNSTKFIHQPMVGINTLVSLTERYEQHIQRLLSLIEVYVGGGSNAEKTCSQMKMNMASAAQSIRAFVAFSPKIKETLKPQIDKLQNVITNGRFLLAKDAYIKASVAPIQALKILQVQESPSNEDLQMVVNSFGTLMQSTLPLYDRTITITDLEFATVMSLSATAGAGIAVVGGGALWYAMAASAVAGPVGLMIVGGAVAAGTGIAAIVKGIEWGDAQKTNPSVVLLAIQKALEECSLFILGLVCMAAERDNEAIYHDMLEDLKDQLQNDKYTKPGYIKAYYKKVSLQLTTDIEDLKMGLMKQSRHMN